MYYSPYFAKWATVALLPTPLPACLVQNIVHRLFCLSCSSFLHKSTWAYATARFLVPSSKLPCVRGLQTQPSKRAAYLRWPRSSHRSWKEFGNGILNT